jgi:cytoskeletal protein CcmA (bactofilin family)
MDYPNDLIGGEIVPPLVIHDKYVIKDEHKGTVYVESAQLRIEGRLYGTLHITGESKVEITGMQAGPIYIGKGSVATVSGAIEGTTNLEQGSKLIVEESGTVEGSLFNNGCMILRGVFGGGVNGRGEIKVEGKGQVKKPVFKDGFIHFE